MAWIMGIDEAGYGPNLGPFVMTAVACRTPDHQADLWQLLRPALRRGGERADGRILVDDSKVVYSGGKGLAGLERGIFCLCGLPELTLADLVGRLCPHAAAELAQECWFHGTSRLPFDADMAELECLRERFDGACQESEVAD